jgi:hypothetical protein
MSQALTPKELALAAAQGVAIALTARKAQPGASTEEFIRPPLICGYPREMFEVPIEADDKGVFAPGPIVSR